MLEDVVIQLVLFTWLLDCELFPCFLNELHLDQNEPQYQNSMCIFL